MWEDSGKRCQSIVCPWGLPMEEGTRNYLEGAGQHACFRGRKAFISIFHFKNTKIAARRRQALVIHHLCFIECVDLVRTCRDEAKSKAKQKAA